MKYMELGAKAMFEYEVIKQLNELEMLVYDGDVSI